MCVICLLARGGGFVVMLEKLGSVQPGELWQSVFRLIRIGTVAALTR